MCSAVGRTIPRPIPVHGRTWGTQCIMPRADHTYTGFRVSKRHVPGLLVLHNYGVQYCNSWPMRCRYAAGRGLLQLTALMSIGLNHGRNHRLHQAASADKRAPALLVLFLRFPNRTLPRQNLLSLCSSRSTAGRSTAGAAEGHSNQGRRVSIERR